MLKAQRKEFTAEVAEKRLKKIGHRPVFALASFAAAGPTRTLGLRPLEV